MNQDVKSNIIPSYKISSPVNSITLLCDAPLNLPDRAAESSLDIHARLVRECSGSSIRADCVDETWSRTARRK